MKWLVPLVVVLIGTSVLFQSTDGFLAFTTEGARRHKILSEPRNLPQVSLVDMNGQTLTIDDYAGSIILVDFIFTNCPWICYAMGSSLEQVSYLLQERGIQRQVRILSISFDPARDDLDALNLYASRFDADGSHWNIATIANPTNLDELLDAFGITVIPLDDGGFEHNAAVHLVDQSGQLSEIIDFDNPKQILAAVEARTR